jgi:flavorubredoxin
MIGSHGWSTRVVEQIADLIPSLKVDLLEQVLCKGFPRDEDFEAVGELAATVAKRHREHGLV